MECASFNNGGDFSVISVQALDCTVVLSEGFSLLRRRGGSRSSRRPAEMASKPADHIGDHLLGHLVLHTGVRHHLQFRSLARVSHTQDARHTRQHTRDTGHTAHGTHTRHKTTQTQRNTTHMLMLISCCQQGLILNVSHLTQTEEDDWVPVITASKLGATSCTVKGEAPCGHSNRGITTKSVTTKLSTLNAAFQR